MGCTLHPSLRAEFLCFSLQAGPEAPHTLRTLPRSCISSGLSETNLNFEIPGILTFKAPVCSCPS